jgi:hypothetical protein
MNAEGRGCAIMIPKPSVNIHTKSLAVVSDGLETSMPPTLLTKRWRIQVLCCQVRGWRRLLQRLLGMVLGCEVARCHA